MDWRNRKGGGTVRRADLSSGGGGGGVHHLIVVGASFFFFFSTWFMFDCLVSDGVCIGNSRHGYAGSIRNFRIEIA